MKFTFYKPTVLLSILTVLIFTNGATAQTTTITVKAINKKGEAIAGATIAAISSLDSSKSLQRVADSNGTATMALNSAD